MLKRLYACMNAPTYTCLCVNTGVWSGFVVCVVLWFTRGTASATDQSSPGCHGYSDRLNALLSSFSLSLSSHLSFSRSPSLILRRQLLASTKPWSTFQNTCTPLVRNILHLSLRAVTRAFFGKQPLFLRNPKQELTVHCLHSVNNSIAC